MSTKRKSVLVNGRRENIQVTELESERLSRESARPMSVADQVRAECSVLILKHLPYWKQNNLSSRMTESLVRGGVPQSEIDAITASWDWVVAMRAESNLAPTESRDPNWPAYPVSGA